MSTPRSVARGSLSEPLVLGGVVLAIGLASFGVAYMASPLLVPLVVLALVGAALVVWRPEIGLFVMFAMLVLKPEAIQGLGFVGPNTLLSVVLAGMLFVGMVLGRPSDFIRSNEIRAFLAIGLLLVVNWAVVGRTGPPGSLAELDYTGRALYRYVIHLSLLVFLLAFVRTRNQLLALTGLFIVGILVTVPGALSSASETATKAEALRATAVGGVRSAENANRLAFMCLIGISIVWFALQHYRSLLLRAGGSLLILVLVLTVFRSGSRSGVLNLLLLAVLLLVQSRMNPGNFGLLVIAAMVSVTIVVLLVPDAVMQRILSAFVSADAQLKSVALGDAGRLAVLGAGLALAVQNPIMGVGIGNFRWMTFEQSGIATAAHNAYVLAAAEGGVLLLAGYLVLFWLTARDLNRALRQSAQLPQVGLRWLVLATRTNLVLLLVVSLFAEAWKEFYILLIVGTAGILAQIYGRAAAEPVKPA